LTAAAAFDPGQNPSGAMGTIDKRSTIPYYEQLAELLRKEIEDRKPRAGLYQLPSENDLAELHGVSRPTIRHALDALEREGYIYREKGRGSFAATRRVEHELTQLVSTTEAMSQRGWNVITRVVGLNRLPAPPPAACALELEPDAEVYELCRLRIAEDVPLSIQIAFLPAHLCPKLEENDLTGSLYRLLESRYGLRLWTANETLRARGAGKEEAKLLQVRKGTPVMFAERVTYTSTGAPVEYLEAAWRGDRYDFKATLTRPPD
jgi:GntR family transcriptional regulator, N-acetylglucosamine utilization regulator